MNSIHYGASSGLRYSVRQSLNQIQKKVLKESKQASTSSQTYRQAEIANEIVIPKRIERGPTDILKALSSTVKKDYLAPHFKYHDDPFLIPSSNTTKRMYALSQESGRKAAHWIRQEHSELFQHRVADPPIEAYFPKAVYDDKSEVSEHVLQKVISQHLVSDSLTIYGLLEQKGVELTRTTKQSLLELLCYYNSQDTIEEEWIEERWFRQGARRNERRNTWKKDGAADKLFERISPPDTASYSALLCGKAQFGDMVGAYKLYQEARDAGISLPTQVYNKLIAGAQVLKEGHELRWDFVEEMLTAMKDEQLPPDLGTLNAVLETLSTMATNRNSQKFALGVMAEFRILGVEPSPASYHFLLKIFCEERSGVRSGILVKIMDILENKTLTIRDPRDVLFFNEAMEVARYHLSDIDVAYRVNKLLHKGDNYNLIGDSYKESIYYRNFFALVCTMGTFEEFMKLYDKLVPNVYVPEPGIMEDIIKMLDMNGAVDLLPRFWSDLVMFEQAEREPLLHAMLTALKRSQSTDTELISQHADVAWAIWEKVENKEPRPGQDRFNKKITWTGEMLGIIMQVLLRADRYHQAVTILTNLDKRQQEILGVPSIDSLDAFLDMSIQMKENRNAIWCIQYCHDAGFEDAVRLAQKLIDSGVLSDNEQVQLTNIVGQGILAIKSASNS